MTKVLIKSGYFATRMSNSNAKMYNHDVAVRVYDKCSGQNLGIAQERIFVFMEEDSDAPHGGVTAKIYCKVLEAHLLTILDKNSILMHDNAPIHTAKIIKAYLVEQGISIMD